MARPGLTSSPSSQSSIQRLIPSALDGRRVTHSTMDISEVYNAPLLYPAGGTWSQYLVMDGGTKNCDTERKELVKDTNEEKNVKVKVLFFARARDLAGASEKLLFMEEGSTTLDCIKKLLVELPSLKEIYDCMAVALNEMYATDSTVVKDGDELALIPPISGG